MEFLQKIEKEPTYDTGIALLDIYLKKMKTLISKDICTSKFIAGLFTVVKILKRTKCSLIDEWIKKMWCTYSVEYFSAIKK